MKNLMRKLYPAFTLALCLATMLSLTLAASAAAEANQPTNDTCTASPAATDPEAPDKAPPELPTSAGLRISTLNQYSMEYARSHYDEELGGFVLVFRLNDAGKLEALLSYCQPFWRLSDDLARVKAAKPHGATIDDARALMRVQGILNDLLLNAGGGPDYHYVERSELIATAEKVLASEEYQRLIEATKPLTECEKTDARSLMLKFTDDELAEICKNLRVAAYGECSLRLEWLDEMEFSLVVPMNVTPAKTPDTPAETTTTAAPKQ